MAKRICFAALYCAGYLAFVMLLNITGNLAGLFR